MSSDWIERIWLDPRRRVMTDCCPVPGGGGFETGLDKGFGGELGLPMELDSTFGGLGAELGLLMELGSTFGAEGAAGGATDGGGRMLEGTAGIGPVLCARRSSSESAGSPTTCSAASSTARARATSPG